MATLASVIPDVDVLVALAPEELAEVVLRLARAKEKRGQIYLSDSPQFAKVDTCLDHRD